MGAKDAEEGIAESPHAPDEWSPGFFERLSKTDEETSAAVDEMLAAIHANRSSTNHFDWWTNDLQPNLND